MNLDKTKVMLNSHIIPNPITVEGITLEGVREYVYPGQIIQLGKKNFERESDRRIQLGWITFGKLRDIFSSSVPQSLKTKVFNQCVPPVMINGAETWTFTVGLVHKIKVGQREEKELCLQWTDVG
ncbi:unnamed protein product [Euphydryas editha]|uniref:Uncharacterized protein n=1 Tax=Euphydryas editha TaxID=104508 RepID=A0AAU9UWK2_EUPED|nr:unnamed protein product [Euphydryas editha]